MTILTWAVIVLLILGICVKVIGLIVTEEFSAARNSTNETEMRLFLVIRILWATLIVWMLWP